MWSCLADALTAWSGAGFPQFASLCRQHGHKFLAPFLAAVSSFGDDTPASTTGRRGADATPRRRGKGGADAATAPAATALSADDVEQLLTSDLIVRAHAVGTGGGGLGLDVGVGGDDDAALFDGRSASGLAINWPVVVDLLLRTRASCALSGLIVMRRCLNADGGDTDMSTRRAPPFVLEKCVPALAALPLACCSVACRVFLTTCRDLWCTATMHYPG